MTPSPHHPKPNPTACSLVVGAVGYMGSRMARHLLRRGCNIVMFDNRLAAYRDAAPGSEPLPIVAKKNLQAPPMNTTPTTAPFDYGRAGRIRRHGARHSWRGDCDVVTIGNLSAGYRHALPGDDFKP